MADITKETAENAEQASEALYKIIDANNELKEQLGEIADKQERTLENLKERAKINQELLKFAGLDKDIAQEKYDIELEDLATRHENNELSDEQLQMASSILHLKKEIIGAEGDELELLKKKLELGIKIYKKQREANVQYEESLGSLKQIAGTFGSMFGIGAKFNQTVVGGLVTGFGHLAVVLKKGEKSWEGLGKGIGEIGDLGLGFILARSEEILTMQDSMLAGFRANTGASEEFANAVYGASEALRAQGLDYRAAGEAGAALFDNVTAYKDASGAARIEAAAFTGVLAELGVGAGEAAELTQTLTQGLGMTLEQATATEKEVLYLARSLDMNMAEALSDLNALAPELIAHGDNMIEVFEGMEKQARKTGLATDKLMGIAAQYDTFEGAATAVGRLNGILGGPYLNSIEMLYATEDERLELLRESLAMSGRQFNDLSRFEKKALATAGGFQSAGEAAAFFNSSLDDPRQQEAAARQKELTEIAREMKPMFEKLQLTLNKLALSFKPLIDGISRTIEGLGKFLAWNNGGGAEMIMGLAIGMKAVGLAFSFASAKAAIMGSTAAAAGAAATIGWAPFLIALGLIIAAGAALYILFQSFMDLPDIPVPEIPGAPVAKAQGGIRNFAGGAALVGEEGPELVHLAKGTTVATHKETVVAASEALGVAGTKAPTGADAIADLKTAFKSSLREVLDERDKKAGSQKAITVEVPVNLEGRELGRFVKKIMNKELDPRSWAGN